MANLRHTYNNLQIDITQPRLGTSPGEVPSIVGNSLGFHIARNECKPFPMQFTVQQYSLFGTQYALAAFSSLKKKQEKYVAFPE